MSDQQPKDPNQKQSPESFKEVGVLLMDILLILARQIKVIIIIPIQTV